LADSVPSATAAAAYPGQRPGVKAAGDRAKARGRASESGTPQGVQLGIAGRMTRFDSKWGAQKAGYSLNRVAVQGSQTPAL
jgi:hypothetical protein